MLAQQGDTPLRIAANIGNTGAVRQLLQIGSDVDIVDAVRSRSLLILTHVRYRSFVALFVSKYRMNDQDCAYASAESVDYNLTMADMLLLAHRYSKAARPNPKSHHGLITALKYAGHSSVFIMCIAVSIIVYTLLSHL